MVVGWASSIAMVFATLLFACSSLSGALPADRAAGIRPEDAKFYDSEIIACRDGSNSFSRARLNDDFCDCADGTDEPGTSACPQGKFYCGNEGSTPQLLFSSRVNDRLCDCCDGSDEYDGGINCPNTCSKNEDVSKNNKSLNSTSALPFESLPREKKNKGSLEDLVQKLKELKVIVFLEIVLIMMAFRLFHRHIRSRRRWYYVSNPFWKIQVPSQSRAPLLDASLISAAYFPHGRRLTPLKCVISFISCSQLSESMDIHLPRFGSSCRNSIDPSPPSRVGS